MIDLQGDRAQEEDDEAVVDQCMHEAGGAITHECSHFETGQHVLDPLPPPAGARFLTTPLPAPRPF